jgi:hypothetical protein
MARVRRSVAVIIVVLGVCLTWAITDASAEPFGSRVVVPLESTFVGGGTGATLAYGHEGDFWYGVNFPAMVERITQAGEVTSYLLGTPGRVERSLAPPTYLSALKAMSGRQT